MPFGSALKSITRGISRGISNIASAVQDDPLRAVAFVAGGVVGLGLYQVVREGPIGALGWLMDDVLGLFQGAGTPQFSLNGLGGRAYSNIANPAASRTVVYGLSRVDGSSVYSISPDGANLYMVIPVAGHEIESFEALLLDDEIIWTGRVSATNTRLDENSSGWEAIDGIKEAASGLSINWHSVVTAELFTGTATQPASQLIIDGSVGNVERTVPASVNAKLGKLDGATPAAATIGGEKAPWTSAHQLKGVAYIAIRVLMDRIVFNGRIPTVTAVIRGKKVYDPRTLTTAWSDNAALCIRDYLVDTDAGLSVDAATEIDDASFSAAADICDEAVGTPHATAFLGRLLSLLTGNLAPDLPGGDPAVIRYGLNGVIDRARSPADVLESMLTACAGSLMYRNGRFALNPGAWAASSLSLGPDDIRGGLSIQSRRGIRDTLNKVEGRYVAREAKWVQESYPPVILATAVTADGQEIPGTLDLPFTTDGATAQRLAKLHLLQNRRQVSLTIETGAQGLAVAAGDTIALTLPTVGWTGKTFRVEQWEMSTTDGAISCQLGLREIAITDFAWDGDTEEVAVLPTTPGATETARQRGLAVPTGVSAAVSTVTQNDGTLLATLTVSWDASTRLDSTSEAAIRRSGGSSWTIQSTDDTSADFRIPADGASYEYAVRFTAPNGLISEWQPGASTIAAPGDTTAPTIPAAPVVTEQSRFLTVVATAPNTAADADIVALDILRSPTDNSSDGSAVVLGRFASTPGGVTRHEIAGVRASADFYVFVRYIDRSGNVGPYNASGVLGNFGGATTVTVAEILNDAATVAVAASDERTVFGVNSVTGDAVLDGDLFVESLTVSNVAQRPVPPIVPFEEGGFWQLSDNVAGEGLGATRRTDGRTLGFDRDEIGEFTPRVGGDADETFARIQLADTIYTHEVSEGVVYRVAYDVRRSSAAVDAATVTVQLGFFDSSGVEFTPAGWTSSELQCRLDGSGNASNPQVAIQDQGAPAILQVETRSFAFTVPQGAASMRIAYRRAYSGTTDTPGAWQFSAPRVDRAENGATIITPKSITVDQINATGLAADTAFIADLVVDTLQIADDAVVVPEVFEDTTGGTNTGVIGTLTITLNTAATVFVFGLVRTTACLDSDAPAIRLYNATDTTTISGDFGYLSPSLLVAQVAWRDFQDQLTDTLGPIRQNHAVSGTIDFATAGTKTIELNLAFQTMGLVNPPVGPSWTEARIIALSVKRNT